MRSKFYNSLFEFLENKYLQYNHPSFIESDPISIPHRFTRKEDIEISGFLTATIAWGNRKSILADASKLLEWMDHAPSDFILDATDKDLSRIAKFYHRTFNGSDTLFFIEALRTIYLEKGGLEKQFNTDNQIGLQATISSFRRTFLETSHETRSAKHLADPSSGSAAKRILMFLRWMVRKDDRGVDFGIWESLDAKTLMCPLDVHSGNVARKLGLLTRKQNDWKAVEELTTALRTFDPLDPVKYDFALFGLGVFENYK